MPSAVVGWLLLPVMAAMLQAKPPSDREWRAWLDKVRPLLMPTEEKAAKKLPAAGREAFREQGDTLAEVWIYRNHPRLPTSPEGFSFRFTEGCEAVGGPTAQGVLQEAARSYLAR
jgi:hypothetical protein